MMKTSTIIAIVIVTMFLLGLGFMVFFKDKVVKRNLAKKEDYKIIQYKKEFDKLDDVVEQIQDINKKVEKLLSNFKPSIGKYTMGDITKIAKEELGKLEESLLYQEVKLLEEATTINEMIKFLKKTPVSN